MTRPLKLTGSALALFVLAGFGVFLLVDSGSTVQDARVRKTTYGVEFASAQKDTFTVMTYNLGPASAKTINGSSDSHTGSPQSKLPALDLIRQVNPDILGFQNVDLSPTDSASPSRLKTIATRLKIPEAIQAGDQHRGPLPWLHSQQSGEAVLSRFPIRRSLAKNTVQSSLGPSFDTDSFLQIAALDVGGWPLIVMNAHLNKSDPKIRKKQTLTLMELYGRLSQESFPILVIGTFNSLMPAAAPSLSTSTKAMGLVLERTNLIPVLSSEAAQLSGKIVATYPADSPKQKIDYILHSPNNIIPTNAEVLCGDDPPPPSNHCAVALSFLLPRPKDRLPKKRIPDARLPSLDRLLNDKETE